MVFVGFIIKAIVEMKYQMLQELRKHLGRGSEPQSHVIGGYKLPPV